MFRPCERFFPKQNNNRGSISWTGNEVNSNSVLGYLTAYVWRRGSVTEKKVRPERLSSTCVAKAVSNSRALMYLAHHWRRCFHIRRRNKRRYVRRGIEHKG